MSAKPSTGSKAWPIGIVMGLSAVAVANAIMISIAISNPSAPASADHWKESLEWDRELATREASAALGWSLTRLERDPDMGGLRIELVDRRGEALAGLAGHLSLERADSATHDLELELVALGEGRYLAPGELPGEGLYQLTLEVESSAGDRFVTRQRVELGALPRSPSAQEPPRP